MDSDVAVPPPPGEAPPPCPSKTEKEKEESSTHLLAPNSRNDSESNLMSSIKSTLFVMGTALLVFVAFRNTITIHAQKFWGASADFWEALWARVLDQSRFLFGEDNYEYNLIVYGTMAISFVIYWTVGLIYTFFDVTGRPQTLRRYKIQPGTNEPVDRKKLFQVVVQVLFNQIVVGYFGAVLFYHVAVFRGISVGPKLPFFERVVGELAILILLEEVGFYYSHRALHHRWFYKIIHKQHHEWTAPISVTAVYCNPIEHALSNLFPPLLGCFILAPHLATCWLWFTFAILNTLNAHSGYHFPFFPSPEAHDFHHLKFNQCYGVLGVLDRLHGTDVAFRNSKAYSRHVMLLTLVPIRQLVPEEDEGSPDSTMAPPAFLGTSPKKEQ